MKNEAKERFRYPHIGRAVGDLISVSKLYTVHFFVNEKDYPTPGELHDFWEMIYMDDGRMEVYTELDDESFVLEKGELLIIRPDEYHEFFVRGDRPYNMFIISFASDSEDMRCFFQKNRFVSYEYIQQLIGEILREARRNFSYPLDKICFDQIRLKEDAQGDCLQKIRLTLELLLLQLRREALKKLQNEQTRSRTLRGDGYVDRAVAFLEEHVHQRCRMRDVCMHVGLSEAQLQRLFGRTMGKTVMEYFRFLRISKAKYYIRRREMTISEIAEALGFSSVHHFSSCFRQMEGMPPTQYAMTLKAMIDGDVDGIERIQG